MPSAVAENILCTTNILLIDFVATLTPYRPSTWLYLSFCLDVCSHCQLEGHTHTHTDRKSEGQRGRQQTGQTNISALLAAYGHVPLSDLAFPSILFQFWLPLLLLAHQGQKSAAVYLIS